MTTLKFIRSVDGLAYEFVQQGTAHGYPSYQRVDRNVWCRRLPSFGWSVCTESGEVLSRPFDDAGQGELPPEGVWVSRNGDRSYVYELIHLDDHEISGWPRLGASGA